MKGPFYILLRLWFEAFPALMTPAVAQVFGALGAAAILWGSVNALFQPRLKLLIAYSTVAQLGYLFLLFPLAASREGGFMAWSGGLMLLGAHACAKTAMFLTAGNILHAAGHDRIKDLDGITHVLPVSVFAFGLAGISLIGLPPEQRVCREMAAAECRPRAGPVVVGGGHDPRQLACRGLHRAHARSRV